MPINLNFKSNKRNEPLKTTWLFWSEKQGIIGYQHSHLSGVSNFCSLGCLQFFIPYIGGQVEDVHQWVMSNHIREFDTPFYPKILNLKFINFFLTYTVLNFFTSIQYKTSPHSYILGDKGSKFKEKYLTMRRWFVGCKSDFQKHYEKTWLQMVEMDQEKVTHQNESDYKTRQELSAHLLWQNVF